MSNRKYYTLVAFDKLNQKWFIEFGDYDKTVVIFELEDYKDRGYRAKDLKIITSGETQEEINLAVNELNK